MFLRRKTTSSVVERRIKIGRYRFYKLTIKARNRMGHPIGFFIFIIFTFAPFSSFDCWFFFFTVSASANVYGLDVSRDPRNLLGLVMNIWWFFLFDFKAQSERRNQFGKPKKKNKKRTPTKRTEQQQKGEPKKKRKKWKKEESPNKFQESQREKNGRPVSVLVQ